MEYVVELFKKLGLSSSDAKVYMTLLLKGPSSQTRIAELLMMHRPQVYASLKRLAMKGLVEILGGRPSIYKAVKPEILLKIFDKEMKNLIKNARRELDAIKISPKELDYGVWMLRSYKGMLLKAETLIEKAQIDLAVCGSEEFILRTLKKLNEAKKRGVLVYIIVYSGRNKIKNISTIKKLFNKVKWAISGDIMVVADSKEAVLIQRRIKDYGLYIREPVLIDYLLHDFFNRWVRGKTISDEPIQLPKRFTIHRLALLEARRLLKSGKKLRARIKGRHVEQDEFRVIKGEVSNVVLNFSTGLMHFILNTGDKIVKVGGPDAIAEDYAAYEIKLEEVG